MGAALIVYVFRILDVVDPGRMCSGRLVLNERCVFALLSWKRRTMKREKKKNLDDITLVVTSIM